ncbi:MAG TPA: SDR family oxidoreductase [Tepidiformaceae bacterium]|nr:SDR family oxidoreductase [Tepidiformaceae bacterium]
MKHQPVVVVTGASAGVGRATARAFAAKGASVGLIARGSEGLERARTEVEENGGRALVAPADVSDPNAVEAAAEAIERELGPIDIWVNNAMTSIFAPFEEITPEEFRRVTEVNYLGYVYGTMSALKRMRPRDAGVIVQVDSALGHRSIPLQSAYCGSKHAIIGFTDSLRCELVQQQSKVRISVIDMPALNTPQFGWVLSKLPRNAQPVPPIYQPEVAADAIVWASEHSRRELRVGGMTLAAVLGQKFIPMPLDYYLGKTGYDSQQTSEPRDTSRPDNLWNAVQEDRGAHGAFDARAHTYSRALWAEQHRNILGAVAGLSAIGLLTIFQAARHVLPGRNCDNSA